MSSSQERRLKILIVDDSKTIIAVINGILKKITTPALLKTNWWPSNLSRKKSRISFSWMWKCRR